MCERGLMFRCLHTHTDLTQSQTIIAMATAPSLKSLYSYSLFFAIRAAVVMALFLPPPPAIAHTLSDGLSNFFVHVHVCGCSFEYLFCCLVHFSTSRN